jgi:predicted  nucleic acid-binding Zn-ribbon protein
MKLTNEELIELTMLVKVFVEISKEMDVCNKRLDEIDEEKKKISAEVKDIETRTNLVREREKDLTQRLLTKYGPFKLDMETFEITPA